jgi:hypothetical protein
MQCPDSECLPFVYIMSTKFGSLLCYILAGLVAMGMFDPISTSVFTWSIWPIFKVKFDCYEIKSITCQNFFGDFTFLLIFYQALVIVFLRFFTA